MCAYVRNRVQLNAKTGGKIGSESLEKILGENRHHFSGWLVGWLHLCLKCVVKHSHM